MINHFLEFRRKAAAKAAANAAEKSRREGLSNKVKKRLDMANREKLTSNLPLTNILHYNNINNPCGSGRLQLKGTCWFHSCLNIFLLSATGRRLLKEALSRYVSSGQTLINIKNNSNACPMRGTINLQYFWSYVNYKLTHMNSGKASRDNLVSENYLIRNLGLRNEKQSTEGGGPQDLQKFINAVFPPDIRGLITINPFKRAYNNNIPRNIRNGYKLIGCNIIGEWMNGRDLDAHAICGYICEKDNSAYIYDSNMMRSIRMDWVNNPSSVATYLFRRYVYNNQPVGILKNYSIQPVYVKT
jgi:hypothetical protein